LHAARADGDGEIVRGDRRAGYAARSRLDAEALAGDVGRRNTPRSGFDSDIVTAGAADVDTSGPGLGEEIPLHIGHRHPTRRGAQREIPVDARGIEATDSDVDGDVLAGGHQNLEIGPGLRAASIARDPDPVATPALATAPAQGA